MITVEYSRKGHRVTARGHAGSAPCGHDLICAAVSAVTYTLAENIRVMQEKGWLRSHTVKLEPGDAVICADPAPGHRRQVEAAMDAVCAGYRILAETCPDFVGYVG